MEAVDQCIFYLLEVGGDSFSPDRQNAILLHCLGLKGQRIWHSLPGVVKMESESVFQQTKGQLDDFFVPKTNVAALFVCLLGF